MPRMRRRYQTREDIMTENTIARRMKQEAKADRARSARPFVFDLRGASHAVEAIAESVKKRERTTHDSSAFWFNLAAEIKRGRWVTPQEVHTLTLKFPFLSRYAR